MKIFKEISSYLTWALIVFSITACSLPHCPKKENPSPSATSPEIVSWTPQSSTITTTLIRSSFTSELTGYVCGVGGAIYKTTDGCNSFTALTSGTTEDLYGIWFTDTNTGYAVGNASTILKTVDGGVVWTPFSWPNLEKFRMVYFVDANTGYITGGAGVLLKTTNAGASWNSLNPGTTYDINAIFFTDLNTGYIGGINYSMFKTTDGGNTWTSIDTGTPGGNVVTGFLHLSFVDSQTGYAIGGYNFSTGATSNSVIIKTTDGGLHWVQQPNPAGIRILSDIKFLDSNIGYVTGGDINNNTSLILKTINGGTDWTIQPTSTNRLNGFSLLPSGVGYAFGMNGAILKGNL